MAHKVVGIESSGFDLPDIAANRDAMVENFLRAGRKLIDENRAEVIIPTGITQCPVQMKPQWLTEQLGVPVVEGIGAPIRMARLTEEARFDSAAQLLGAVHRLDGEAGFDPGPRRRELEQFFAQPLVDALGTEEYASEQAKGATMGLDDAVELARSLLSS